MEKEEVQEWREELEERYEQIVNRIEELEKEKSRIEGEFRALQKISNNIQTDLEVGEVDEERS